MLDEIQMQAVDHLDGPCLVTAGPGSGKTTVIIERIKNLVLNHGIPGERILVITFTKAAAMEMKERYERVAPSESMVFFGTFHSVFFNILREEEGFSNSDILMGPEKTKYIMQAMKMAESDIYDDADLCLSVEKKISRAINAMQKPGEDDKLNLVYNYYSDMKKKMHKLDFDDMLLLTLNLFLNNPLLLKKWRQRFDYYLVDEVQDMNKLQFRILSLMCAPKNNIFAVGDEDQSIYGFRGAEPGLMLKFPRLYRNCKLIKLINNYRNASNLLTLSNALIDKNKDRFNKVIVAEKNRNAEIAIKEYKNPVSQAEDFAGTIREILEKEENHNVAVLYRNNYQGDLIEEFLIQNHISYKRTGLSKEYGKNEIILSLFLFLKISIKEPDRDSLIKLSDLMDYNFPGFIYVSEAGNWDTYIKNAAFDRETRDRLLKLKESSELVRTMNPYAAVNFILKSHHIVSTFEKNNRIDSSKLQRMKDELDYIRESLGEYRNKELFLDFLDDYLNLNSNRQGEKNSCSRVFLHTFHSSKGLEFDTCLIPDMNEGVVPGRKALAEKDMEEERRMFYVAITRTRNRLLMGYISNSGDGKYRPSRFLSEMNFL